LILDEDNDEDPFEFLEDEGDISHYKYSEFHFIDFFSFDDLFFYSGYWSNQSYFKNYNLLKFKK
jgi:hypothetical protein